MTRVQCPECGRQTPMQWGTCRCGYRMTDDPDVSLDASERGKRRLRHKFMQIETEERLLAPRLSLAIAWGTDPSLFHFYKNYDSLLAVVPQDGETMASKGALFVVADGLESDHREQEERISQRAVRELMTTYYQAQEEDPLRALERAVKQANIAIYRANLEPLEHGRVISTCVALVVCGETVYGMNVGNDRAYLLRQGQAKQLSRDHNPGRIIYRSLGDKDNVEGDMFVESVQGSDTWVLCTDGLHHFVTDEELSVTVEHADPRESVEHLILLAKEHGAWDDITVMVVKLSLPEG